MDPQSVAAARECSSTEEESTATNPPSAGGRWWLQSWFPAWSGWYGAQELTDEHPQPTESSCDTKESENALGINVIFDCEFNDFKLECVISTTITTAITTTVSVLHVKCTR